MATLRFLPADDPRLLKHIDTIRSRLSKDGWLFRYQLDDGFGNPTVAFIICTFWLIEALVATRRSMEGVEIMKQAISVLSPLGLLSEDYDTSTGRMWGNYPQCYSHVGLINAAFAASPGWSTIL